MAGYVTRFAPSPTGRLHLGHAFSVLTAAARARAAGGRWLLRIEDTDLARCRPDYEQAIYDDLHWLGLSWPAPVLRQSDHLADYAAALDRLIALGLCYPCRCTRGDIRAALSAPQEGVTDAVYPGTCRHRPMGERGPQDAVRLDMARALAHPRAQRLDWQETGPGHAGPHRLDPAALLAQAGDVILARRDIGTAAYHLSVVIDDARQGVTEVVRGEDLYDSTPIHRLLQALLELPTPSYHHHVLIRDEAGKRLAKRDDARALATYRDAGATPQEIRDLLPL